MAITLSTVSKQLRHSHITWLLEQGVLIHIVQARVGHSNPTITLKVYAHVSARAQQIAVEALNAGLIGGTARTRDGASCELAVLLDV
ncbi:MAG: tyrosine-type recombinase/integrase [Oscillospiraceae bacterium]|jgi:integrase|nr:tyrosine-type recombinase/integrase [Oscillospiraceae bacterium]